MNDAPPRAAMPEQAAAHKARARQNTEILVGALVIVAFAVVIIYAFTTSGIAAREGYPVIAEFGQVDGLVVGSQVSIAGLTIGQVTGLKLDLKSLRPIVTMTIDNGVELPADSSARVATDSLLGSKFIKIDPGGDEEMIPPGGRIEYVQDSVIVERLLQKIVSDADARRKARKARETHGSAAGTCPCANGQTGGKTGE